MKKRKRAMQEFDFETILNKEFQIFVGRIGSGKTEITINVAIKLKEYGVESMLFDMDIVKPYIRIRDVLNELSSFNLEIVSPPELTRALDLPIFPKDLIGNFLDRGGIKVLDVGGDSYGAGAIAQFREYFRDNYNLLFVINTKRPFTSTEDEIIKAIAEIQLASKMNVTHLIFNTNLRWETTKEVVEEGFAIVDSVSKRTGIPIAFGVVDESRSDLFDIYQVPILKLKLFVNPLPRVDPWTMRRR